VVFKLGFDIVCVDETLSEMYRHFKSHANSLHSSLIGMHDVTNGIILLCQIGIMLIDTAQCHNVRSASFMYGV